MIETKICMKLYCIYYTVDLLLDVAKHIHLFCLGRRLSEVQEANTRRVKFLEDKMADTVQRYENRMTSLRSDMSQLEVDSQNQSGSGQ